MPRPVPMPAKRRDLNPVYGNVVRTVKTCSRKIDRRARSGLCNNKVN